ncbi:MAG TPA: tetratricopeptide repeat protein, partial [Rhodopila sp.]|nr:tetratricopeptide repeat protein [Rhodopila sp.]
PLVAPPRTEPDTLRALARSAYAEGRLADAAEAQSAVLALSPSPSADDILFAGLVHHAARAIPDGIRVLRDGVRLHPRNPALHENLAVLLLTAGAIAEAIESCQAALALGSDSFNVHDCLCDAHQRAGRPDLAIPAGRLALESKDRRFGAATPLVQVPATPPTPFNPGRPDQNVIAYTLWGNQPRYLVPLLENARIRPHLFPEWTLRVHHDHTVEPAYLDLLVGQGVQLRPMRLPPNVPAHRALLWRFEVIADPTVQRFLIRDADSLLTVKERVAVDAWLHSSFHFHAMRDWYTHTDLLLAGMWGGIGNILPPLPDLLRAYTAWRMENDHLDQDLLSETVWPAIRGNILIHDSIFHPCLGSTAFPPFGALPAGHHIGQNAFVHFSKPG